MKRGSSELLIEKWNLTSTDSTPLYEFGRDQRNLIRVYVSLRGAVQFVVRPREDLNLFIPKVLITSIMLQWDAKYASTQWPSSPAPARPPSFSPRHP